ncbi:MAG: hypothetical protein HXY22_12155 [Alphaproteobacteria bacterium]|nr:hypothetical protein [Alphaproteobacteria bacterium]
MPASGPILRALAGVIAPAMIAGATLLLPGGSSASEPQPTKVEDSLSHLPKSAQSDAFYVLANVEFTVLHELGHALIHTLNLPVLGKEEDAADTIAVAGILISDKERLRQNLLERVTAISDEWLLEWKEEGNQAAYWDSHSLEIQRFYNIVCLIYGSDPERFKDIAFGSALPEERSFFCEEEFELARSSLEGIIAQHGKPNPFKGTAEPRRDSMIEVRYDKAYTRNGEWLSEVLKKSGLIEHIAAEVDASFVLPEKIKIEVVNCDGAEAYFHTHTNIVVLCWQLLESFLDRAKRREAAGPQSLCAAPIAAQMRRSRLGCPN